MLNEEVEVLPVTVRRERMLQVIAEREFVRVADLAGLFGTSEVTVRTDLAVLEAEHGVRRVRGGALAPSFVETSFEVASGHLAEEKARLGERAAAMVTPGMSVLLDVGTTTTAIARALVARTELEGVTVVTNGLMVALELEKALGRITVVVLGGTLRRLQHSLVDPWASFVLGRLHADLAFLGCNGVDVDGGVTNLNLPEAEIKARMIAAAERAVVVADGSKLGQVHLAKVAGIEEISTVLTGPSAPAAEVERLRSSGVDVVQVE
ncbi:DeoR/GlpR family DNA-binding transcription regulator [Actinotalea sp.]|uniref:DeoR/GlpR family DNA-binding transcription regulator n=1 Tax=Actinotalea sp. TaxID=1872145 RepID=UPI00356A9E99